MIKRGTKAIIRPPRSKYNPNNIPTNAEIPEYGNVERISIAFQNSRHDVLFGSFYAASEPISPSSCVVYLHGNCSNQLEGRYLVSLFIPVGISVFCFDFSGCGCSTGKYVTLGYNEIDDVKCVFDLLRRDFKVEKIMLWGRSMGAAISLMILKENYDFVTGAVLDSPYESLVGLFTELGETHAPKYIVKKSIEELKKEIMTKAKFDISDVNPTDSCEDIHVPVLFIHGVDDRLVKKENSERMFSKIRNKDKQLKLIPGQKHNDDRPTKVIMDATVFLCKTVGLNIYFSQEQEETHISQNSNQHLSDAEDMLENLSC